jgi:Xaa-Pro aminopeptidase
VTVTESQHRPRTVADLAPMDVVGRLDRLRALLRGPAGGEAYDGIVVSNLTNVRYLTGFTGSAAVVLVTPDATVLVTDGRYRDQSAAELSAAGVRAEVVVTGSGADAAVGERAADLGVERLALEADSVSWSAQRRWAGEWFPSGELVPTSGLVEQLRLVKDAGEVARIRAACAIADEALERVRPILVGSPTELAVARELDETMKDLGAADVSFETIVASGPNGARPHHRPGGRVIGRGDLVVIDFGALVDGYHSDMTRTLMVGDVDDDRRRMFEVVLEAQAAGVEAVRAGVAAVEVDAACRSVIADAGWGDAFLHSTGHGVGLDIHEEPRVSTRSSDTLVTGHIVTVEPGVYLTGLGGVRIEDTVLVTDDGCERLTLAPKQPAAVPG